MIIHSKTDKGIMRNTNQDAFLAGQVCENFTFAIVCDGMGGANAGNVASEIAVKTVSEYISNSYRENLSSSDIEKIVKNAINSANFLIYDRASKSDVYKGMGTTITVAVVKDNTAVLAHAGDSRIYLVNDKLTQLTTDHSVVQTLIETGQITADDAKTHPRRNVITKALGVEPEIIPDFSELTLSSGDTLLLCTDGLTNFVTEDKILETFNKNDISAVSEMLVDFANQSGGGDNITLVTLTRE